MKRGLTLIVILLLTSCRSQAPQRELPIRELEEFPRAVYLSLASSQPVFQISPEHSRIEILVHRDGVLAHLGHDHVVSTNVIEGYILYRRDHSQSSLADLRIDLTQLIVDDEAARQRAGLDAELSASDIRKTGENMHARVLETDSWPEVRCHIEITGASTGIRDALLTLLIHGVQHQLPVQIQFDEVGEQRIRVRGALVLRQSEFNIQPFSVLGGGLAVRDEISVSYQIEANRVQLPLTQQSSIF